MTERVKVGGAFECVVVEVDDGSTRQTPWCANPSFVDMDVEIARISGNRPLLRVRAWGVQKHV